jgi:two-component system, LytTR family, response regulator LytT
MNVLVIEYEKITAQKIKDLLYQLDESIHVVGITDDMLTAAEWLTKNKVPDLILANENLMAGVDKEANRAIKTMVRFSTITEEYNLAAFRYKTMRQLLSNLPATEEKLLHAEKRAAHIEKPAGTGMFKERFLVKQGQRLLSIPVTQIAYFFSQERFIFLKTFDNQKFLLEYRIEQLENLLSPAIFFRINRSCIISLPTVKEIHPYFGNRLKSRKRVNDFKAWLGK